MSQSIRVLRAFLKFILSIFLSLCCVSYSAGHFLVEEQAIPCSSVRGMVKEDPRLWAYGEAAATGAAAGTAVVPGVGTFIGMTAGLLFAYGTEQAVATGVEYGLEQGATWAATQGRTVEEGAQFSSTFTATIETLGTALLLRSGRKMLTRSKVEALDLAVPERVGSFNSKVFTNKMAWQAPNGTQQTYKIYQRNDINWNMIRTKGDRRAIGITNAEAARKYGSAPQLKDGNFATLHHLNQNGKGNLVEASTRYHGINKKPSHDIIHQIYGKNKPHPVNPVNQRVFQQESKQYWKYRGSFNE